MEHKIITCEVKLRNSVFHLYEIIFYVGTDRERTVVAAETPLENLIESLIENDDYDKEVQAVDNQYGYVVPEEIDDDRDIIKSIWDVAYEDEPDAEWDYNFELVA